MLQIIRLGLIFTTRNGTVVSVSEEPALPQTNCFVLHTVVRERPAAQCHQHKHGHDTDHMRRVWQSLYPIASFVGCDCTSLPCVVVTKIVHHGLVSVCLNQRFQKSCITSHGYVPCHPRCLRFSVIFSQHVFDCMKQSLHVFDRHFSAIMMSMTSCSLMFGASQVQLRGSIHWACSQMV